MPLGERAVLSGRVDRLERDEQGRAVVVDLKTGSGKPSQGRARAPPAARRLPARGRPRRLRRASTASTEPGGAALLQLKKGKAADEQMQPALPDDDDPDWARELVERVVAGHERQRLPGDRQRALRPHLRRPGQLPAWPEGEGVLR